VADKLILPTRRLSLVCLTASQLECCLYDIPALEAELGFPIARSVIDANVTHALGIKLVKLSAMPLERHPWQAYWLIVVKEAPVGIGLIGFKSYPNADGETEIGYGVAPEYQGKGYMTEAVRALCDWAFSHPFVSAVTATTVMNPASNRVLEKVGAQIISVEEKSTNWKIQRGARRV
jgi:[ribosomal protein S5]-alanine N-acetyltransferase